MLDALIDVHYFDLDSLAKKHKLIFSLIDTQVFVRTRLDTANRCFEYINPRELGFFEWFNIVPDNPRFFSQLGERLECFRTLEWKDIGELAYADLTNMFFPYLLALIQALKRR